MSKEKWVDVEDVLRKGQAALKLGETLHVTNFASEQAMTAIEIGDPRMDVQVDEKHHLPSLLATGALETDISFAQAAQLLDCLTSKLVQWWQGCSLQQTLYTSMHLLAQDRLDNAPVLLAITGLVSAIVSITKHVIAHCSVINVRIFSLYPLPAGAAVEQVQEEDCSPHTVVTEEAPAMDAQAVAALADKCNAAVKACNAAGDSAAEAVKSRMLLLQSLYAALRHSMQPSKSALERCKHNVQHFTKALETVADTQAATATGDPPGIVPDLHSISYNLAPQPVQPLSNEDARAYLASVAEQLQAACAISALYGTRTVLSFSEHFSRTCAVPVCRGVAFQVLAPDTAEDEDSLPDWAPCNRQFVESLGIPWAVMGSCPEFKMFVEQSSIAIGNYLQALYLNRARARRRLRRGMEDWERMRVHAVNADYNAEFRGFIESEKGGWTLPEGSDLGPCQLWIGNIACASMATFLMLGFELDLYEPSEFAHVFWYCAYILDQQKMSLRAMIESRPSPTKPSTKAAPAKKGKDGKKKGKAKEPSSTASQDTINRLAEETSLHMVVEVKHIMCTALSRLCAVLQALELMPQPPQAFGSAEARYEQRFECFRTVESMHVPFEVVQAQTTVQADGPAEQHLLFPINALAHAIGKVDVIMQHVEKQSIRIPRWEHVELHSIHRVAKHNMTACKLIMASLQQKGGLVYAASWEFKLHWQFPSLTLTRAS